MRLLLDTHVLLWWLTGDRRLGAPLERAIESGAEEVAFSAASAWEIAIKAAAGRLRPPTEWIPAALAGGFRPLPITVDHATEAGALPPHHTDPFDRMLVAQARLDGFVLASVDRLMARYDVPLLQP